MRIKRVAFGLTALIALFAGMSIVQACPFCSAPSLTLSEQLSQSDAVVLVQWVEGQKPDDQQAGNTTYEIVEVLRGQKEGLEKEQRITLARYRAGKKGDLFMLMGNKGTSIEWNDPMEVTETSFNYIAQAPSPEAPKKKRLAYFLKFLEYPDQLISNDAYAEFANAPYEDVVLLKDILPRKKIRKWLTDPDTSPTRLGLYGLMLGLCGNEEDAELMRDKITQPTQDFRLGIDGVIAGYLLLTGQEGLNIIDKTKLKAMVTKDENGEEQKVPFSETYAAMQALRFMWTYGDGAIGKDRLRQSMRVLLDRPELADLVIADLARWQDWSVQDKLMKLYDTEEYNIPSIKRAIVRYMIYSIKDKPEEESAELPEHVVKGQKYLQQLEEKDPKTVREAKRFLL